MSKRRTQGPEFQAKVATDAICGRKAIQEIVADDGIDPLYSAHLPLRPIQMSEWKNQFLECASALCLRGKKLEAKGETKLRRLSCSNRSVCSQWSWSGSKKSQQW
jgi:hypothetical protein